MRLTYDSKTDMLYISLAETPSVESGQIGEDIVADYSADGAICGFEIEHASLRAGWPTLHLPTTVGA